MKRAWQVFFGMLFAGLIVFVFTREPKKPALPRWQQQDALIEKAARKAETRKAEAADTALIRGLLKEELSHREFDFPLVVEAVSGKKVLPAVGRESRARVSAAITSVMDRLLVEMNSADSPVRGLRRINEGSRFFEDGLLEGLEKSEGITCGIPPTREGGEQRSGYPDLRIIDEATGDVYYLDPKLMERGAATSSLRTFYFEPKDTTLKITEDASHLLLGIEHDGKDGEWKFLGYQLVDLSGLKVRLKAEFQASNRDLYKEPSVLEIRESTGKDGGG
ncbi:MAG: hypothetical protein RLZZ505_1730 [Verrucomicrobiota bacterium]